MGNSLRGTIIALASLATRDGKMGWVFGLGQKISKNRRLKYVNLSLFLIWPFLAQPDKAQTRSGPA